MAEQAPAAAGNQTTWTWSGWVNLSATPSLMDLCSTSMADNSSWATFRFDNSQLEFFDCVNSGYVNRVVTNQQFSMNTWYQVTLAYDTTQAVATNRIRLYVNGQQITSFATQ